MGQRGNNGLYTVTMRGAAYEQISLWAEEWGVSRGEVVNQLITGRLASLVEPAQAEAFRERCDAERPRPVD